MSSRASSSAIVSALIMPRSAGPRALRPGDADAVDAEATLQAIDRRDQAADVGGVPRPHLRAHRSAVAVKQHGQDHLIEIGPMILGEAATPQSLAARAPRT